MEKLSPATVKMRASYERLLKSTMLEIAKTPKDNPERFKLLKKKLKKYYEYYKGIIA